jgi:hypothetical protein
MAIKEKLHDKAGDVVDKKAKRPSNPETVGEIEALLIEVSN